MHTRTVVLIVILCALILPAFAVEDEITLKQPTKAGAVTLPPGTYHVRIKGSLVFFVSDKDQKSLSTVATIEKVEKKSAYTTVEGPITDAGQQAQSILLQGADFKIVFSR